MSETATDPVSKREPSDAPANSQAARVARDGFLAVLVRRPVRKLAILLLLSLISLGVYVAGLNLWAGHHRRAARDAVARYHDLEARPHLDRCLRVWPRDPEALLLAAHVARRRGDLDVAESFLDRLQQARGLDDDLVLERLLLRLERGEIDDLAEFCQDRVRSEHPDAPLVLEAMARGFTRGYRFKEAEECLDTWRKLEPENAQIDYLQGIAYDEGQRTPDALHCYRAALARDPRRDETLDRLTELLARTGLCEEALPLLRPLCRRRPESPELQDRLARCLFLLGRTEEARGVLEAALRRWPDHPGLLAERGELALNDREPARAEAWFRRSLEDAPGEFGVLYQLHRSLVLQEKHPEAKALKTDLDEHQAASERLRRIRSHEMQQRRHDPALLAEAGRLSLRVGSFAEGLRWLESALRLDPTNRQAHEALADFYQRTGNAGLATRHREQVRNSPPARKP